MIELTFQYTYQKANEDRYPETIFVEKRPTALKFSDFLIKFYISATPHKFPVQFWKRNKFPETLLSKVAAAVS